MPRFAFGVTLTPAERALFCGAGGSRSSFVRSHTCVVTLPDGTACSVSYMRYNPRSHRFDFGAPLDERIWIDPHLDGSVAAVEQKAQEIAPQAFAQAQEAEQKAMRRKTLPQGSPRPDRKDPAVLPCKAADPLAGKYAVCIRFANGTLTAIGEAHETPDEPVEEIGNGHHENDHPLSPEQEVVVGIFNRALRRWQEPRFLAVRPRPLRKPDEHFPAQDK